MSKYAGTKTEKNLMDAFAGESQARNKYTYYASQAKKAGFEQLAAIYLETADQEKEHAKMWFFEDLAKKFELVAEVEARHEKRYLQLLEHWQQDATFKEKAPILWKCRNCGYVYEGAEAPDKCPCCDHPKAYFERFADNY